MLYLYRYLFRRVRHRLRRDGSAQRGCGCAEHRAGLPVRCAPRRRDRPCHCAAGERVQHGALHRARCCRRAAARGYALGTRRHRIRGRKRRCHSGERRRGNRHFHGGARRCGKDHPRRGEHRRRHRHHRLHGGDACGRIPGRGVHSS